MERRHRVQNRPANAEPGMRECGNAGMRGQGPVRNNSKSTARERLMLIAKAAQPGKTLINVQKARLIRARPECENGRASFTPLKP
jgi:hypothetical protein